MADAVESGAHRMPAMATMRSKIWFLDFATTQLRLRLLKFRNFQPLASDLLWFRRSFTRIGDSVCIENANKQVRKAENDSSNNQLSSHTVLHRVRREEHNVFKDRGVPIVTVPDAAWDGATKMQPPMHERTRATTALNPEWHVERVLEKDVVSKSAKSRRHALAALQACTWLVENKLTQHAGKTWQACCFAPQSLVHDIKGNRHYYVISKAEDAVVVWPLQRLQESSMFGLDFHWTFMHLGSSKSSWMLSNGTCCLANLCCKRLCDCALVHRPA